MTTQVDPNRANNPLTRIYNIFAELHYMNYHTNASELQWETALLNAHGKVKEVVEQVSTATKKSRKEA